MITRTVYVWFKNHPGQWSIEELEEKLPYTRKQIQTACHDLVKRGRISKVADITGMWELTHIKIMVPDEQVARAIAQNKTGSVTYVPRIEAHTDPIIGPKGELLRGDLVPAGWRVIHGYIPDRNFSGTCKFCGVETQGRDVVAITGGVIHQSIGAQTSDWFHLSCAHGFEATHITERVYWGIIRSGRDRRLIDPDWAVVNQYLVIMDEED